MKNLKSDVTKDLEKLIKTLDEMAKKNDYTIYAEAETIEKLQYILKNIFEK